MTNKAINAKSQGLPNGAQWACDTFICHFNLVLVIVPTCFMLVSTKKEASIGATGEACVA